MSRTTNAAVAAGLVALALAGCGGNGSANGTPTETGGVLGAHATIRADALAGEARRVSTMIDRQLGNIRAARSQADLVGAFDTARQQLLSAADRLDRLELPQERRRQQRGELTSLLRSLAADMTTLKLDARSGDYASALAQLPSLGTVTAIRDAADRIARGRTDARATLRAEAFAVRAGMRERLASALEGRTRAEFESRVDDLSAFVQQQRSAVSRLDVPTGLADERAALARALDSWDAELARARTTASSGHLDRARAQLGRKSQAQLGRLVERLGLPD